MKRFPKLWFCISIGLLLAAGVCVAQEPNYKAMMLSDTLPQAGQQVRREPSVAHPLPIEPSGRPPAFAERYGMEEDLRIRAATRRVSRWGKADDTANPLVEPRLSASPKTTMPSRTLMDLESEGGKRMTDVRTATAPGPFPVEPK